LSRKSQNRTYLTKKSKAHRPIPSSERTWRKQRGKNTDEAQPRFLKPAYDTGKWLRDFTFLARPLRFRSRVRDPNKRVDKALGRSPGQSTEGIDDRNISQDIAAKGSFYPKMARKKVIL
jgi:hypothetical protein